MPERPSHAFRFPTWFFSRRPRMDFFDVLAARHSVRDFSKREVGERELKRILQSADAAPSAGNLQSYQIVVVTDQQNKAALAKAAYGQEFIGGAPVVLVFCADPDVSSAKYARRGLELFCIQDATIAASYAQLAAAALGLATVWVGAFDERAVTRVVGGLKPVCVLPIGYAAAKPDITRRRKLHDLIRREHL